ncbi:hypothetical protein ABIA68_000129 [Stenotrophomonas rhizophila]|uniref:hypothetical protein n=1 Tax=Stenotrophomonas rhizophila TaxID=216778 RepID=UPI0033928069
MKRQRARAIVDASPLTPAGIRRVVLSVFPRRHDYGDFDLADLVTELAEFGIATVKPLRLLMKKHRRQILIDERVKMPRAETLYLASEYNPAGVDVHSNTSWYAVPGLVRQAMEKEFGWDAVIGIQEVRPQDYAGQS